MTILKCKMCGGELQLIEGTDICECEYCGTKQTVPTADNEKKITLFDRANRLRMKAEFDKAATVYESIVTEFPEEAEGYWGLCLCKYGIEYVDDPQTGKKVPTCHRTSFDGIFKDPNFEMAQEYSDGIARNMYREEAKEIDRLQKAIIEVAQKEDPFDIFICYKETDENGNRTKDSVRAQEIYNELTKEGYKVFFSRITLEDKLGEAYEPYIFSALNSAKIMLAIGTKYDYYNAVWVKNEWSRFIQMMKEDSSKKLIPCYSDIDAYDMPEEFSSLQGQDMAKIGFLQDLMRGIDKILGNNKQNGTQNKVDSIAAGGVNIENLLQRGYMSLEDEEWDKAKELFDNVLNVDANNAEAYLGIVLADGKYTNRDSYAKDYINGLVEEHKYLNRAEQFASEGLTKWIKSIRLDKKKENTAQITRFDSANNIITSSAFNTFGLRIDGKVVACGKNDYGQCDVSGWKNIIAVHPGRYHTVGLRVDGTVVACGKNNKGQCNVSNWRDIIAIAVSSDITVGLKSDGTVVAAGIDDRRQNNIHNWNSISAIAAADNIVVGLKSNGTVVVSASDYRMSELDVSKWKNIVSILTTGWHIVGLKSDGTVVVVGENHAWKNVCFNVSDWKNIVEMGYCDIIGGDYIIGLQADGRVVKTGAYWHGEKELSGWDDIITVLAGDGFAAGLKSNGTVIGARKDDLIFNKVLKWENVVAISAHLDTIVALKTDGTVVSNRKDINDNISNWKLFNNIDTLDDERKAARIRMEEDIKLERIERQKAEEAERKRKEAEAERARKERETRYSELIKQKNELNTELSNLKGLFNGKRRKQIESELNQINQELSSLSGTFK